MSGKCPDTIFDQIGDVDHRGYFALLSYCASSVVRLNVLGATTGCMGVRARRTWWFLNYDSCETKSCMMHELLTLTRGAVESTIDIRGVLVYLPPGLRTCTSAPADWTFLSFSRLLLPAQLMNIRRFHWPSWHSMKISPRNGWTNFTTSVIKILTRPLCLDMASEVRLLFHDESSMLA